MPDWRVEMRRKGSGRPCESAEPERSARAAGLPGRFLESQALSAYAAQTLSLQSDHEQPGWVGNRLCAALPQALPSRFEGKYCPLKGAK